jgi:hypothetical protein
MLCHPLGKSGDKYLVMVFSLFPYLTDKIIDLSVCGANADLRIKKTRGTDNLLGTEQLMLFLIFCRGGRYKEHLIYLGFEFLEVQLSVIQRGGKSETIIHQSGLP